MHKLITLCLSLLLISSLSQTTFRKPGEENIEKKVIIKYDIENDATQLGMNDVKLRDTDTGVINDEALEYQGSAFEFEGYEGVYDLLKNMEALYTPEVLKAFWMRVDQVLSKEVGYWVYKDEGNDFRILTQMTDYTQGEMIGRHDERKLRLMEKAVGIGKEEEVEDVFSEVVVFSSDVPSGIQYEKKIIFMLFPELQTSKGSLDLQLYGLDNLFLTEMNEILRTFVMGALNSSNTKIDTWSGDIVNLLTTIGDRERIFSRFLTTSLDSENLDLFNDLTDKLQIVYGDWQQDGWSNDVEKYNLEEIPKEQWFYLLKHICTSLAKLSEDREEFDTEKILSWIESVSLIDPKTTMETWNSIHDYLEIETKISLMINSFDNALGYLPLDNTPIFLLIAPQTKQALMDHLEKTAGLVRENWIKGDLNELDCSFLNLTHCENNNEESNNEEPESNSENQHVDL